MEILSPQKRYYTKILINVKVCIFILLLQLTRSLKPFHATGLFLNPLKTLENLRGIKRGDIERDQCVLRLGGIERDQEHDIS